MTNDNNEKFDKPQEEFSIEIDTSKERIPITMDFADKISTFISSNYDIHQDLNSVVIDLHGSKGTDQLCGSVGTDQFYAFDTIDEDQSHEINTVFIWGGEENDCIFAEAQQDILLFDSGICTKEDNPDALEIEIEIPEDATPERIQEIVKEAASRADMTHRSNGGNGLTIKSVEVMAETRILQPSGE